MRCRLERVYLRVLLEGQRDSIGRWMGRRIAWPGGWKLFTLVPTREEASMGGVRRLVARTAEAMGK